MNILRRRGMGFRRFPMRRSMRGFMRPYRRFMWRRPFLWYPLWWRPLFWRPWPIMIGAFMFLLYDSMAYKLSNNNVRQIERDRGQSVNDLTEAELVAAMKRLDIQKLELTEEDKEAITKSKNEAGYCTYCGAQLSYDTTYCATCGKQR